MIVVDKRSYSPEEKQRFEEALKKWNERLRWITDEVKDSERLTAEDLDLQVR